MRFGEYKYTKEEKKKWISAFTKYFHIKNNTGRSKIPEEIYLLFEKYYTKYKELEQMKRDIIKSL